MSQPENMQRYYRFHAKIYEATRWTFLFGRKSVWEKLKLPLLNKFHLLEVGCGTGYNLALLAESYPNIKLSGIDVSPEMLAVAQQKTGRYKSRVSLFQLAYGQDALPAPLEKADIILISYCLTMVNPGWENVIETAARQLQPGSRIAVVDFHQSRFSWFTKWMQINHVRMDAQLLPVLEQHFDKEQLQIKTAYGGLWRYFIFIGKPKT